MRVSVAFPRWFEFVRGVLAQAVGSWRRSCLELARKILALVLAEALIASSAMALTSGPAFPHTYDGAESSGLTSLLLQSMGINPIGPKLDLAFPPLRNALNPNSSAENLPDLLSSLGATARPATAAFSMLRPMLFQAPAPGISGLQPNSGAPGTTITITGANFGTTQGAGSVTFNGAAATITSWSNTSIQAVIPTGATSGIIAVTTNSGATTTGGKFAVINPGGISVDRVVTNPSLPFSTNAGNELLLAFVATAASSGANGAVSSVSGGNLTWVLVKRTNVKAGSAEVWRAFAPSPLTNVSVSASAPNALLASVTVVTFMGVDTSGTNGSGAIGATGTANSSAGAPSVTVTTTRNNSLVFGVAEDPANPTAPIAGANQTVTSQNENSCVPSPPLMCPALGSSQWVQQHTTAVPASGTSITLNDTTPSADPYNFSAVEILPATSLSTAPLITNLSAFSGAPGTLITITGVNFGASQGTVTFNGTSATPSSWSATSIVVPVPDSATTGNVTVSVAGQSSNGLKFIVTNPAGMAIDQVATGGVTGGSVSGATLSTSSGNEVLLLLASTAPNGGSNSGGTLISPPQGGGLTWEQVETANTQDGTAEVWRAFSPYILDNASITYNPTSGSDVLLTVVAILGADPSGTNGSGAIGAIATSNSASGAPTASVTTTRANSFVFGVGDDPTAGVSRTLGASQIKLAEFVNNNCFSGFCSPGSYTLWAQRATNSIATSGTAATINDTAPTNDAYNLSVVEVRPPDTTVPSITSLSPTTGPVGTSVTITGSHFGTTQGSSTVTFAGVSATPTSSSSTSIVVPVPQGVPVGPASVVVSVTGAGTSAPATFTVVAPLSVTASVAPSPNAAGWNNTNVTVSFQCTGGVLPVQCPGSQTITTEVANQTVTGTATDANGNQASASVTVKLDKTSPQLSITSPANNATVTSSILQVSGTVSDALSGVAAISCNGTAGTVQGGTFTCTVSLVPGANTVAVVASDAAGNTATQSVSVTLGPGITDFTPKVGPIGTAVSILGTSLSVPPNATTVTFAGPSGPLAARVNFASATQLAVVVPDGAITGPITVTTSAGTASTAVPFTVGASQDFQVTLAPGTGTLQQASSTAFVVGITSSQTTFTQLASLSVTGLPQGVLANFTAPQITAGANSTLSVDLSATNLAIGTYPFTLHALATIDGKPLERTANGTLNVIAAGQTTLAGVVLSTANEPIVNASITLDGQTSLTDGAGRFFLAGIQPGAGRPLSVDGHSAFSPNETFPLVFEPVNVIAGRANVVPTPFHLPPIDTSQEVTVDPTRDTVAGNAAVANLQMTIPAGANLRMLDGTLVTRTSITPLAPDRTPAPLPSDVGTNLVYTAQPGGAITDIAIPVIYPNQAGLDPGTRVELYAFDHSNVKWYVYGFGRVSTDGRTIAPEIDPTTGKPYGLKDFSWNFPDTGPNGNPSDPNACPKSRGPHPVDYATGMKIERVPQVSWGGARGAFKFELIYTNDKVINCLNCPFGRGWTHNWDIKLSGTFAAGGAGRLILPDQVTGNLLNSSGTDASGTPRFTMSSTPSALGSQLLKGPSTTQYRDADGTILNFDSSGRLLSRLDKNGNATSLTYSNGNLVKITDSVGRSITLDYDASNRVITMTDPLGHAWHYTYEGTPGVAGAPGLTTITDPLGNVTRYSYVNPGRLSSVVDPRGNTVKQITYDANGRVASQTFADGATETYNYQLAGTIVSSTTVKNAIGATETRRFNGSGYVIGITDASGQTATIQRDLNANVAVSVVGSCGCSPTQRKYSLAGDVTDSTNAVGSVWHRDYQPDFHVVTTSKDPLGNQTTYTYDQNGNLQTKKDALGQITTYGYNSLNELISIMTPSGGTSQITYDPQGSIDSTTDPAGKITHFEHDLLGHVTAVIDPMNRRSSMQYDEVYHLISTTDPAGKITHYEYDANGNRTAIVNPLGKRWTYTYDARNRLIARRDPLGNTRSYTYDAVGHLLSVKTPLGRETKFTYTPRGQIASKTAPNGETVNYEYDASGNLTKLTDARGNTISYKYDAANRLVSRTDPLGRTNTISYDAAGNVISRTDRFGRQTTYTYDVLNRPVQVNYADASVSITYDPDGRVKEKDDSTGGSIQWEYDTRGLLSSETTANAIVDYAYNDAGQQTSVGVRGRVATQYQYDDFGRLSAISFGAKSFSFQYDDASRRTAVIRPNGITSTYSYDDANHLIHISHANASGVALEDIGYAFDADGRIVSTQSATNHTLLPASASTGTADANNRLPQFNDAVLSYDDLGQLISNTSSAASTTYDWDGRGRLTGVHLPNGNVVQYSYDAMSRLASRSVNGANTNYVYGGMELLLRSDSFGTQFDLVNGTIGTERLLQSGTGGDLYFLQDRLFSVLSLADSSGALVEQESYEPFGNGVGSTFTEYGYIGERLDPDSHLMFLNWRFYDPVLQRFITEDPIGTSGGINVFAYSEDDPINAFDPSGLSSDNSDWLYTLAQWSAGAGDTISFGFTNWVRDQLGINDVIDKCSLAYQIGGYTGDVVNYSIMALSLAGPLLEAGAAAAEGIEAAEAIEEAEAVAEETAEIPKSIELTNEQAADILSENGLNPDFLNSFDDGPISLRQVDEGEQFLRYTDDAASPGGSFLTESEFGDSAEAADALYTRPYGNNASFQQLAVANQSTYVLQGGIANGAAGVQQIIVLNRSAFTFSAGYIF